jgi:hypothetical protein
VSRRLSLQKGFERLVVYDITAPKAGERIEKALYEGDLQLFRDGELLKSLSDIKTNLRVVVERQADGRWLCTIAETHGIRVPVIEVDDSGPTQVVTVALPPSPIWEVDVAGIEKLRGMRSTERWTTVVDDELRRLRREGSSLLKLKIENLEGLYGYLTVCVNQRTGAPPPDPKRFRRRIRDFLGGGKK